MLTIGGRVTINNSNSAGIKNIGKTVILKRAQLVIDSTTAGSGIRNLGYLENNGLIDISGTNNSAIVVEDTLLIGDSSIVQLTGKPNSLETSFGIILNTNSSYCVNEGKVIISGFRSYGITSVGAFINQDSIIIQDNPGGGYSGTFGSNLTNQHYWSITDCDELGMYNNGTVTNDSTARLIIENHQSNAVLNDGSLVNKGEFTILNTPATAYINNGHLFNEDIGTITIDSTVSGVGIFNTALIENGGTLQIRKTDDGAICNMDSLLNRSLANLVIRKIPHKAGILNDEDSWMRNEGTVDRQQNISGLEGILNKGNFKNANTLIFNNIEHIGIENEGQFINEENGSIFLENTGDYGINSTANSILINHGLIQLDSSNYGIHVIGHWTNYDTMTFAVQDDWPIEVLDTLINEQGGYIYTADGGGTELIVNKKFMENRGTIKATANHSGIENYDTFVNMGSIILENSIRDGIENFSSGVFTNEGLIEIHDSDDDGIENFGHLINMDTIVILNAGVIGVDNSDTLENRSNGYIEIRNTNPSQPGLANGNSSLDYFLNAGEIIIDAAGESALFSESQFIIEESGIITIINSQSTPLIISIDSEFICLGQIEVYYKIRISWSDCRTSFRSAECDGRLQ